MMKNCLNLWIIPLTMVLVGGCGKTASELKDASSGGAKATGPVTVVIDTGTGEPTRETVDDVADGATLESVMRRVESAEITFRGSGTTAFVESIGELGTTGGEGWTFQIDDEFANQGIGQLELHPPTTVRWSYGGFE